MSEPEDFGRVGDLLGDVCERAGQAPAEPREEARGSRARAGGSEGSAQPAASSTARSGDHARLLAEIWREVAGEEVAANASPVQLRAGRLTVSTSSSVWAQTLQYMELDLATRLNARLGDEVIKQIVFRHAGWEESLRRDGGTATGTAGPLRGETQAELSVEQEAALADVEGLDLPAPIREKMINAMRASFVRAQRDSVR